MNATSKRRLLKLADFLETTALPGQFDMGVVAEHWKNGKPACGTAACAMGWATMIPSFRRAGLHLSRRGAVRIKGQRTGQSFFDVPQRFFEIDYHAARHLFGGQGSFSRDVGASGLRAAIDRIRTFVAQQDAEANTLARRGSPSAGA